MRGRTSDNGAGVADNGAGVAGHRSRRSIVAAACPLFAAIHGICWDWHQSRMPARGRAVSGRARRAGVSGVSGCSGSSGGPPHGGPMLRRDSWSWPRWATTLDGRTSRASNRRYYRAGATSTPTSTITCPMDHGCLMACWLCGRPVGKDQLEEWTGRTGGQLLGECLGPLR